MKIILISSLLPYPLKSGGAQAVFNMVNNLRTSHEITFVYPENGKNTNKAKKELQVLWPNVHIVTYSYLSQLLYIPFLFDKIIRAFKLIFLRHNNAFQIERALKPYGYYFNYRFISFINKVIKEEKGDVVQIEFYPYLHLVNYLPKTIKKIFVHHEIRYIRNERLLSNNKLTKRNVLLAKQLKEQEISDLNKYNAVITLTDVDKKELKVAGVKSPIFVSPAAINAQIVSPKKWNGSFVFVGGFSHIPNQEGIEWFLSKVCPLLKTTIHLNIVGKSWPTYSAKNVDIKFLGFVDNLEESIAGSIMIVPLLTGSGMRMKILEAAAMGLPIITTSIGVEGLNFIHKVSCLTADTASDFAAAVDQLPEDETLMQSLAKNAQDTFKKEYSIEPLVNKRVEIYKSLLS